MVLHKAYEKNKISETFSFEITKIGNRIRFFLICPKAYTNFLKNQVYGQFSNVEIHEVKDYLYTIPNNKITVGNIGYTKHTYFSLKTFDILSENTQGTEVDPYSSITSALSKTGKYTLNTFQVTFTPVHSQKWKQDAKRVIPILTGKYPKVIKNILLHPYFSYARIVFFPIFLLFKLITLLLPNTSDEKIEVEENTQETTEENLETNTKFLDKISSE